jgi:hypothetical protein
MSPWLSAEVLMSWFEVLSYLLDMASLFPIYGLSLKIILYDYIMKKEEVIQNFMKNVLLKKLFLS